MKILLLNQCFHPDVVSTAQHCKDLACALEERGHQVSVIASSRGYDDSSLRFASRELWRGIRIFRIPCLAAGKGSRGKRALNFASFLVSCFWRLLFMPRYDLVIALTSPPLISALAALFVRLKGGRFIFWIMDLNPDEAIAAGWLRAGSTTARALEAMLRFSAGAADRVVVLDRFMRDRMAAKGVPSARMITLPPWSHDREVCYDNTGRDAFRALHRLTGKYVVMYSGNHSPCHPLDTILEAAVQLADSPEIAFCFVGGGSEHARVRHFAAERSLKNVLCLPYQPLSELSGSLSAADLHVIVLGEPLAGLVHPCKIYNVMALGIPVLFVGPVLSHVGDIARQNPDIPIAVIAHQDVSGAVSRIRKGAGAPVPDARMKEAACAFSVGTILPEYTAMIEAA